MTLSLWMLQNTLAAGCLAAIVAIACRFGRFSPAVRHALWLLVLLKLVTPPLVEFPVPRSVFGVSLSRNVQEEPPGGRTLVWIAAERFYDFSENDPDEGSAPDSSSVTLDSPAPGGLDDAVAPIVENGPARSKGSRVRLDAAVSPSIVPARVARWPWERSLLAGWCVGTALFVLIQGSRLFNLRRMKNGGRADAGPLTEIVARLSRQMRVKRPPVWIVPDLPTPALCAWGRASLLWPEEAVTQFTEAGERAVVLHELAHLRRRDHWVGWLELVTGCVWWWNPLFWFVRHQLHENAELACDSWVVALLPEERRAYAEALIDVAQGEAPSPLAGVVLGAGDGSRKLMERRLIMIMRGTARYQIPAIGVAVLALVALATIPRWTIGKEATEPESTNDVTLNAEGRLSSAVSLRADAISGDSHRLRIDGVREVEEDVGADEVSKTQLDLLESKPGPQSAPDEDGDAIGLLPDAAPAEFLTGEYAAPGTVDLPVQDPFEAATPTQVTTSADAAPADDQIKRLEAQLSAIQSELNSLRNRKPTVDKSVAPKVDPTMKSTNKRAESNFQGKFTTKPGASKSTLAFIKGSKPHDAADDSAVETVVMTRSTYKLPAGRAAVLERALRELLNDEVEIKVKNDALQITAAQEDQDAIHHLIRLMQRKGREPTKPDVRLDSFQEGDIRKVPTSADSVPSLNPSGQSLPSPDFKPPERR